MVVVKERPSWSCGTVRAAVAAGIMMAAPIAQAGIPVADIPGLVNAIQNFLVTGAQYKKEVQQWKSLKEDAKIGKPLNFYLGLPDELKLEPVASDYMIAETCGEEARGWTLVELLGLNNESVSNKEKQRQACVNIQVVKNQKYNSTVEFLDTTLRDAESVLSRIAMKRGGEDSTGNVQSASNDVDQFNSQLTIKVQQWEARMKSYDAYIEITERYQNQLAKAALKGQLGMQIIGDAGQSAALMHALDLD